MKRKARDMKILLLILTFTTFSWAQNNTKDLMNDQAPCTFEMTVEQLTSDKLLFQCPEVIENQPMEIQNFRIKFRGHGSILVSGNSLNDKSKQLAAKLSAGDNVTIFDVEKITTTKDSGLNYNTFIIKIVE